MAAVSLDVAVTLYSGSVLSRAEAGQVQLDVGGKHTKRQAKASEAGLGSHACRAQQHQQLKLTPKRKGSFFDAQGTGSLGRRGVKWQMRGDLCRCFHAHEMSTCGSMAHQAASFDRMSSNTNKSGCSQEIRREICPAIDNIPIFRRGSRGLASKKPESSLSHTE